MNLICPKREPPTFNTLSEDVVSSIFAHISSWADLESTGADWEEKRKQGQKATDSTLRAIVLSSRASYQRWILHLIRHVTVSNISMASIYLLLQRRFDLGRFIKFIKIEGNPDNVTEESSVPFMILWEALNDSAQRKLTQQETTRVFLTSIFRSTENLETLLLSNGVFSFPLVDRVGTQTLPFRFMTQALKRLHISKPDSDDITDSFNYLTTYSNTFQGRSKVRKLAIRLYIVWDGIKNGVGRWNGVHGNEGSWIGGNLETETAYRFLLVTNQLQSLEIMSCLPSRTTSGDEGPLLRLRRHCLSSLNRSYESMKHLRLTTFNPEQQPTFDISVFKNLKILCSNGYVLRDFERCQGLASSSLEIFHLFSYCVGGTQVHQGTHFQEEIQLSSLLDKDRFPNLRLIIVPTEPIDSEGKVTSIPLAVKLWKEGREVLEENKNIKEGKVKLVTIRAGETVGDASKGENCISTLKWISPFPQ